MINDYYNEQYFSWQRNVGELGGKANLFKFEQFIMPTDKVIDFGCGGGYLLKNINCHEKIGIEINESAIKVANENKIKVFKKIQEIPDNWADKIISNHALEHVLNPFDTLLNLKSKLKKDGAIIFVVPQEFKMRYKTDDINQHLYSWSPLCLGNLFASVGFKVIEVEYLNHKWPPYRHLIWKYLGKNIFHLTCKIYAFIRRNNTQIRILAINV